MSKTTKISGPKPSVIFLGSGPVAAASLERLVRHAHIEAVITKPKPPHHRGDFPVTVAAEGHNIPLCFVQNASELSHLFKEKTFNSDVGVLIDFGIIVDKNTIDAFPLGIVNSHFSILPEWRGPDPITFAVLSGQRSTGVSLMVLSVGLDEGPLIAYSELNLDLHETTPGLTERLIEASDQLFHLHLPRYISGELRPFDQRNTGRDISYSHKLFKQDGVIDWSKPALQIEREIRAYAGWPKSRTVLAGIDVIITSSSVIHCPDEQNIPGTPVIVNSNTLIVHAGSGCLSIERLKPAGKKEMTATAFIAGYGSRI